MLGPAPPRLEVQILIDYDPAAPCQVLTWLSDHPIAHPLLKPVTLLQAQPTTPFRRRSPVSETNPSILRASTNTLLDPPSRRASLHSLNNRDPVALNSLFCP